MLTFSHEPANAARLQAPSSGQRCAILLGFDDIMRTVGSIAADEQARNKVVA